MRLYPGIPKKKKLKIKSLVSSYQGFDLKRFSTKSC